MEQAPGFLCEKFYELKGHRVILADLDVLQSYSAPVDCHRVHVSADLCPTPGLESQGRKCTGVESNRSRNSRPLGQSDAKNALRHCHCAVRITTIIWLIFFDG